MLLAKKQKERYLQAFLLALIVSGIFFGIFIITGRGYFLYYGDFNVQQIPFYKTAHDTVRSGNVFWNWNTDLGANFIGSYSFYLLGSPFFWLTIPFPSSWVPHLMGPLLMLKFAFSSLTAYCYLRRFTRYTHNALIGALLYAFSGFSVYNIFFNHFHEAIVYFPLLLLTFEQFMCENRRGVFGIMVFLCAVSNYYFFCGMAVFLIIYFIVKLISGAWKITLKRFGALAFEAIIGTCMAAFILVPSYFAVIGNSRATSYISGWGGILYSRPQVFLNIIQCFFFPPDNPARPVFFPDADIKWSSISGWLPVFGMTGVIAWLQTCKGTWQKRMFTVCAIMALVPFLNSAFYMFNYAYYARWFYMTILIMTLMTAQALERTDINWAAALRWSIGITLAFTLIIGLYPTTYSKESGFGGFGLFTDANSDTDTIYHLRFWTECAISIVSLVVLTVFMFIRGTAKKRSSNESDGEYLSNVRTHSPLFWRGIVAVICIITVIYSGCHIAWGKSHSYETDFIVYNLIESKGKINLDINDGERIDVYDGMDNTGMFLGYPTIQAFHSIVPDSVFDYYDYVGVERTVGSRPEVSAYQIRGLLSVRYLLDYAGDSNSFSADNGSTQMPGFEFVGTQNDFNIYENKYYVPYGFTYDYATTQSTVNSYYDGNHAAVMMKAMILTDEQIKRYSGVLNQISDGSSLTGFDQNSYLRDCSKLQKNVVSSPLKIDNTGFTSEVSMSKDNLVFYAVPYDKGWSVTVDGKEATVEKANVGFMAVYVEAGNHTVRFNYMTPGLTSGICVSLAAFVIFAAYLVLTNKNRKLHPEKYAVSDYEREQLENEWLRQDMAEVAFMGNDYCPPEDVVNWKELIKSKIRPKTKNKRK